MEVHTEKQTQTLKKGLRHRKKWTGHTESNKKKQSLRLQDVASSRNRSGFLGLCRAVQHQDDQELPGGGTAHSWLFMYRQEKNAAHRG